jgi:hypothetical protein
MELAWMRIGSAEQVADFGDPPDSGAEMDAASVERFGHLLDLAAKVRFQNPRRRGPKVYSRGLLERPAAREASELSSAQDSARLFARSQVSAPTWLIYCAMSSGAPP